MMGPQNSPRQPTRLRISPEDAALIEAVVYFEAAGEGQAGRDAVRAVIFNRLASPDFPDTVPEVLNQERQFEPVMTKGEGRASNLLAQLPPEVVRAGMAEHGAFLTRGEDPTRGATFFQSRDPAAFKHGNPYNQGHEPDAVIGNHAFYRHYEGNYPRTVPYQVSLDGEPGGNVYTGARPGGSGKGQQQPPAARPGGSGKGQPLEPPEVAPAPEVPMAEAEASQAGGLMGRDAPQALSMPLQARTAMPQRQPRRAPPAQPQVPRAQRPSRAGWMSQGS